MTWGGLIAATVWSLLLVAGALLGGAVWQARRSRAHARAQRAFLAGGWR